jgi:hypothetical protein
MVEQTLNPVVPQSTETAKDLGAKDKPVAKDLLVFPIPPGFVPPEGVDPGESFEAVCRLQYRRGKLILEAVEGHEVHLEQVPTPKLKPSTFESAVEGGLQPSEGMA